MPAKKPILTWLEANAASVSAKAFAKHLDDAAKPVRDLALRGLIAAADLAIEVTLPTARRLDQTAAGGGGGAARRAAKGIGRAARSRHREGEEREAA
ncbi:MAG: hypothetical protein H6723_02210 [Sandaracinus sp.]|nr:hypothetical protein [Sandaracinus sp.]